VTNVAIIEGVAPADVIVHAFAERRGMAHLWDNIRILFDALRADYVLLHFTLQDVIFFAVMLTLIPFHRCRLEMLDFFVVQKRRPLSYLIRWSIKRVDKIFVFFKDFTYLETSLGIPRGKFCYLAYKVNSLERIRIQETSDQGYLFCGGRSRRDFATLFEAIAPLGYPLKLVTSPEPQNIQNGSSLAGLTIPKNVEWIENQPQAEFFVRTMAGARAVVIPIRNDHVTQAGISVYLQAMALRKCVVISEGLGVSDVLTENQAVIVPGGDAVALRAAIERVWKDSTFRERYALMGYDYASSLGGDEQLARSLLKILLAQ
jgi:glycosyltransferase involved in cell wall biosynthesis